MDHVARVPPPIPTSAPAVPLPLRFALPAGWPAPSMDWLAANQGWDPPPGWTPVPDVAPAPANWSWWEPDPVGWKAMTGHVTSAFRRSIVISSIVFVIGLTLTLAPLTLHTSFGFVFWGAIVFAPINAARSIGALRRSRASFLGMIKNRAAEVRQTLDTSTYSSYLTGDPLDPMPFDRFLAARAQQSWSYTGEWPFDQNHLGVTDQFRLPSPATRSRRVGTIVFACLAGVTLITLVVSNLGSLEGTSETGAAAGSSMTGTPYAGQARIISSGSGAASVAGGHDGPAVATSFVGPKQTTNAQCTTDDCWVIRSKSTPDCRVATIVMEFEVTETGKPDRHETITVPLREGVGDVAVEAHTGSASQTENYSDVADAWCSNS